MPKAKESPAPEQPKPELIAVERIHFEKNYRAPDLRQLENIRDYRSKDSPKGGTRYKLAYDPALSQFIVHPLIKLTDDPDLPKEWIIPLHVVSGWRRLAVG